MPSINVLGSVLKSVMEFIVPKFVNEDGSNTTLTEGKIISITNGKIATNGFRPSVIGDVGLIEQDGIQSVGVSNILAQVDHIHPSDETKANTSNPVFTGITTVVNMIRQTYCNIFTSATSYNLDIGKYYFFESYGFAVTLVLPKIDASNVGSEILVKTLTLDQGSTGTFSFTKHEDNVLIGGALPNISGNNSKLMFTSTLFNGQYGWVVI